ncbi:MAG: hypothetical protein IT308_02845 [Anaerolineaceae bacterium]|nr:hypothetical protein [Anaerolineaceae bacterium]
MTNNPVTLLENGWIVKVSRPKIGSAKEMILLLHGWTGDENSMWLFTHRLGQKFAIAAPRAPLPTEHGGYAWVSVRAGEWNSLQEFSSMAKQVNKQIPIWLKMIGLGENSPINLMGFSQGAALAYTYAFLYPEKLKKIACLSGFLLQNSESLQTTSLLSGKQFFVAHGTDDEIVPIEFARQSVKFLQKAGAKVVYCEENVGHKLGTNCFEGINHFFQADE